MVRTDSGPDLLHDLVALNQYLSQPTSRRNSSLALPSSGESTAVVNPRRLSLSIPSSQLQQPTEKDHFFVTHQTTLAVEKTRGFLNWKPIRMLTHIGKRRISCLFSVEVAAIRNLPESMNGLRLSVGIRKGGSREGLMRSLPSRVLHGTAEFEETLFIQSNVYCSGGAATGKPVQFEPRPFLISIVSVNSPELELGSSFIDVSQLIGESAAGSLEGFRIRLWDAALELAGKAAGGQLVLRLGFQILDDGVGIYSRKIDPSRGTVSKTGARRLSKNSFSISALDSRARKMPIFEKPEEEDLQVPVIQKFDGGEDSTGAENASGVSIEIVKEVVHKRVENQLRLMELNSIANEIKDLELMMSKNLMKPTSLTKEDEMKQLDDSEQTVTREFLKMLDEEANNQQLGAGKLLDEYHGNGEAKVKLPDLGNGLGPVIQTKDGGFLASMNPFDVEVFREDKPKLALQISKPFILRDVKLATGFEIFQRLAAAGCEKLCSRLVSMADMDELQGKTAEQIAFEGIASAIISGRNKEGASSSAAKSFAAVKRLISEMSQGRKARILKEIRSVEEKSVASLENILAFSMRRTEEMMLEALKIQADMAEDEASSDVSQIAETDNPCEILDSAISLDEWLQSYEEEDERLTVLVIIQLRDPARKFEVVGAPVITLTQVIRSNDEDDVREDDEEKIYKVTSLHAGGVKVARLGDKSKLAAIQWLLANGVGKQGKKSRTPKSKLQQDVIWSLSSTTMEDLRPRPVRNPDVKIAKS